MLLHVDKSTGFVRRVEEDLDDLTVICSRFENEVNAWLNYRNLAKTNSARYDTPALHKFQHMLLALNDFVEGMKDRLTEKEESQLQSFCSQVLARNG